MRTGLDVMFELNQAVQLLDFAAIYSRTAPDTDPECWLRNQQAISAKIEKARAFLDSIEDKLKIKEVDHVQRTAA